MEPIPVVGLKHVQMLRPCTTNTGKTTDIICLKNFNKAYLIFEFTQAVAHATTVTLYQCTDVADSLTDHKVLTNAVNAWLNEATATSDTMVAQTAAKNFSLTADVAYKTLIVEMTADALDVANGFDCIYATVSDSSQATNFVSCTALLDGKYRAATPPDAITD